MTLQKNDMQLLKQFLQFIADNGLFTRRDRVLVAVSGGLDSACLAHLCREAGFNFAIAHVNFKLRGEESNEDELFVRALAKSLGVPFHSAVLNAANYSEDRKVSVQVAARELRYAYFKDLMASEKYERLLTAHHAEDNAETMLMNFLKGTGINGLRGILPLQGNICRPLLFALKDHIREYALQHSIEYREDSSNITDKYTRNFIRHEVFPVLAKAYPSFRGNLLDNVERFREISGLYQEAVSRKLKKMIVRENEEVKLPVLALLNSGAAISLLHEVLQPFGFSTPQLQGAAKLLKAESGKFIESEKYRLLRNRGWLIVSPKASSLQSAIVIEQPGGEIEFAGGTLRLKLQNAGEVSAEPDVADVDADLLDFPLLFRKWKTGDYFYPLGMKHKKKLSRFFVDQKLSLFEKENVWVLESKKRIVWVAGLRIDDRFKITPRSKTCLRFSLMPK